MHRDIKPGGVQFTGDLSNRRRVHTVGAVDPCPHRKSVQKVFNSTTDRRD